MLFATATATALGLAALAIYAGLCALRPFTRCRFCPRRPTFAPSLPCTWCRHTGYRLRWGRRLYTWLATEHRRATTLTTKTTTTNANTNSERRIR